MPSVTMKLGTRSRVVARPLMTPMSTPTASMSSRPGRIRASSWPMKLPASTTCVAMTAAIDRSNSPLTITKYWPIAAMAIGAVRPAKRISAFGSAKFGFDDHDRHEQGEHQQEDAAARAQRAPQRPGGRIPPSWAGGPAAPIVALMTPPPPGAPTAEAGRADGRSPGGRRPRRRPR